MPVLKVIQNSDQQYVFRKSWKHWKTTISDSNCLLGVRLRKDQTLLLRIHLNYYVAYKTSTSTQKEGCNKKRASFWRLPLIYIYIAKEITTT